MEQYQQYWKDYYDILQVSPKAEQEVISAAYKKLAQKYHPDTSSNFKDASTKMIDINEAYEILSNPVKRVDYDYMYNRRNTINVKNTANQEYEPNSSNQKAEYAHTSPQPRQETKSRREINEPKKPSTISLVGSVLSILSGGALVILFYSNDSSPAGLLVGSWPLLFVVGGVISIFKTILSPRNKNQ